MLKVIKRLNMHKARIILNGELVHITEKPAIKFKIQAFFEVRNFNILFTVYYFLTEKLFDIPYI